MATKRTGPAQKAAAKAKTAPVTARKAASKRVAKKAAAKTAKRAAKKAAAADALTPDRVRSWMEARGVRQATVARATEIHEVRLHRWLKGTAKLSGDQAARLASYMESFQARVAAAGGHGDEAGVVAPSQITSAMAELAALAGTMPPEDERDVLRALARQHTAAAIGGIVRLAVSAKTEGTRLRAYEMLLDRGYGKPPQHIVDATPRPPAEDEELLEKLRSLLPAEEEAADA